MDIQKEISDLKQFWQNSHLIFKAFYLISLFLTISSITNLADAIFAWKGFIRDGLYFYHQWIVSPVIAITERYNIFLNKDQINFLIVISVFCTNAARFLWLKVSIEGFFGKILAMSSPIVILLLIISFHITDPSNPFPSIFYYLPILQIIFLPFTVPRKFKETFVAYYSPIVLVILFVLILGAINSGFNR